jgi:glycogen debranching enzyme GlgX
MTLATPTPLGVTLVKGGVNVAVFSRHATKMFFCLFESDRETRFALSSREGDVYFGFVEGVAAGDIYGLRAEGPNDGREQLFDISKLLIDPYAPQLDRHFEWHEDFGTHGTETCHLVTKCIVALPEPVVPRLAYRQPKFIYEMPVKAFSKLNSDIPDKLRGTVAALAEPSSLAHFKRLGVDTIELMPLMAWADERHLVKLGLANAWGYNPISFFAPDRRLAPGGLKEIRDTIAVLHDAGFRVILDVVYNHTGESDLDGPSVSFSGLDNATYYRHANGELVNDTGCGNTLATNDPPVTELILASMRHWVNATGLDGFRYDLATVMGRQPDGYSRVAPLLRAIQDDSLLGSLIHIAEPWDIGLGGYQLGNFPTAWGEWSDRYRDDVRHFWRGDQGVLGSFATRLAGSSDIFGSRKPSCSINFLAAHDGFTLHDFVSHDHKNNFANGEGNRDGNFSEPCWISDDPKRDARALLASLFISRGTIMLTAGDEFGRSQRGNNNAYAQDNETTWLDWEATDEDLIDDVAELAKFRRDNSGYFADQFLTGKNLAGSEFPDIQWLGNDGAPLNWRNTTGDCFGVVISAQGQKERLLVWFNRSHGDVNVRAPTAQQGFDWADDMTRCPGRSVKPILEVTLTKRGTLQPDDKTIYALADAAGIQSQWWEVNGTGHIVSIETKRAVLKAMALPIGSMDDARSSLAILSTNPPLPRFMVMAPGLGTTLVVQRSEKTRRFAIRAETGQEWAVTVAAGGTGVVVPPLQTGHYTLRDVDQPDDVCALAVTSGRCYEPSALADGKRVYGLTTHLYALRHSTDYGIGDFETLARFCEASAELGGTLAGINPLHHMFTDDRTRVSPYQPSDRRFLDPVYIDVSAFPDGFGSETLRGLPHVDYEKVWGAKDKVLRAAFAKFKPTKAFDDFVAAGGQALQDHAHYESRMDSTKLKYAMWLQWVADGQLAGAAKRGRDAGLPLGIYRDLALGCAFEGGEVWARPGLYSTSVSIGAPPDPFSRDGQVWNLPPFNPLALERAGYAPFTEILRANMRHAGVLRIDHVLGYARQFWVPRGASGADGAYVTMPQSNFLALTALESELAKCVVIGEDLGTVPDGLRDRLADSKILSYRVLWFEQDEIRFAPPENYPVHATACLSSHDLAPFKGWLEASHPADIAKVQRAVETAGVDTGDMLADAHAYVAKTPCSIMLVQADDLSGETEPLNVPGTDKERPNWRRRLSIDVETLAELDASKAVIAAIQKTGRGRDD